MFSVFLCVCSQEGASLSHDRFCHTSIKTKFPLLVDLRGSQGRLPPLGQISLIFMQFLGKKLAK